MRPNRNYWKFAGNAEYGLRRLFADVKNYKSPRRPVEHPTNININEEVSQHVTENVKTLPSNSLGQAPTYITNNYYSPQNQRGYSSYRTMSLWQMVFMILFMSFVIVFTYYLISEPTVIVDGWQRVVDFFQSI